jgi:hypothetical protein
MSDRTRKHQPEYVPLVYWDDLDRNANRLRFYDILAKGIDEPSDIQYEHCNQQFHGQSHGCLFSFAQLMSINLAGEHVFQFRGHSGDGNENRVTTYDTRSEPDLENVQETVTTDPHLLCLVTALDKSFGTHNYKTRSFENGVRLTS